MTVRVYVNGLAGWLTAFRSAFDPQLAALGLTAGQFPVVEQDPAALSERTVVLYFSDGTHAWTAAEVAELDAHVAAGRVVIPVLDRVDNALAKLPPVLHALNACAVGAAPVQHWGALVDEIFARVWLPRRERKIFLSYKRSDSADVAHELRDRLSGRGYEVFLDECTIAPGEAVQRSLMAWLNDADLVLLLASPQFAASTWVREEIEFANLAHIGVLAVCWPAITSLPPWVPLLMSDQQHTLKAGPAGAPKIDIDEIIGLVETLRVRSINRRLCALLPFVRDNIDAARFAVADHDRLGDLKVIFQSELLRSSVPQATLDLADWTAGELIWIDAEPGRSPDEQRTHSLARMRGDMIDAANLSGAVFIGGMEGVIAESIRFGQRHSRSPRFAIGSTGSAAQDLLAGGDHEGTLADRRTLATSLSYPLVMQRIFSDLGADLGADLGRP